MRRHKDPTKCPKPGRQLKPRRPPQPRQSPQPPQARGHCTRYVAVHPLRGGAPEQKRCIAYGSGAVPQQTRTNAELAYRTTHHHTPPCAARPYWQQDEHAAHATTCTPAHANTSYTLKCEEPLNRTLTRHTRCRWAVAGPGRASRSTTPSAARVWRSRGRAAAHRHTQRPGPTKQATRRPEICRGNEQHEAARPHRGRAAHASGRYAAISEVFSASGCRWRPGARRPRRRGRPCRPRPTCPTYAGRTAS